MSVMCALMKLIRVNSRQRQKNDAISRSHSGRLSRSESNCTDTTHTPDKTTPNPPFFTKYMKYIGIPFVILVVSMVVVLIIMFSKKIERPPPGLIDKIDDNVSIATTAAFIIEKEKWGGLQIKDLPPSSHPVKIVILSHTVTLLCHNFIECSRRISSIQAYHISTKKFQDITYNFLIGGDGYVYVGRGWDYKSGHTIDNSIGISFIGDFVKYNLTSKLIAAVQRLLKIGVAEGKLARDYKLICHNQTINTLSPGSHVYSVVKNWAHFDPTNYKTSS